MIKLPATLAVPLLAAAILSTGCQLQRRATAGNDRDEEYYDSLEDRPLAERPATPDVEAPPLEDSGPAVLVRRPPTSVGSLEGDAAGMVIFQNVARLEACYDEAGGRRAGRGVVYVVLDVEPEGAISGVLVGATEVNGAPFVGCLERALAGLSMPTAEGSSVIQTLLVFGARDQDEARRMLREYRAARDASATAGPVPLREIRTAVRSCHERVFRGRRSAGGRLVLGLDVDESGRVTSVELTEDPFDGQLDACVRSTVGELQLQADEVRGSRLTYAVILTPSQTAGQPTPPEPVSP